jgi:hypothetical protein
MDPPHQLAAPAARRAYRAWPRRLVGLQGESDCGRQAKRPVWRRTKAMTLARRTKT